MLNKVCCTKVIGNFVQIRVIEDETTQLNEITKEKRSVSRSLAKVSNPTSAMGETTLAIDSYKKETRVTL